jgi:hypothetical protein
MRIHVTALSATVGLLWGGAVLTVALVNLVWPSYGRAFLELLASIYPGYAGAPSTGQIIMGAFYGLVDGAIGGFLFGWIYNVLVQRLTVKAA